SQVGRSGRNAARERDMKTMMEAMPAVVPMRRIISCLAIALLAGCAVGPDYRQPELNLGDAYRQAAADPVANAGWVQARPDAAPLEPAWWTLYGDPLLHDLMPGLQQESLGVRVAEARYRQAQASLQAARAGFSPTTGSNASIERSGTGGATASGAGGGGVGFGGGASNSYALSGAVSWEVDLWGRVRRSVEAGQAALDASVADIGDVRQIGRASRRETRGRG